MLPSVRILLAVYNGAAFLRPQIDSILAQRGVQVQIAVHDDGSTDGTRAILEEYSRAHRNVSFASGPNVGARLAFLGLIAASPLDTDYYGFADADDVWLPEKTEAAIETLERQLPGSGPKLYASQVRLVDDQLRDLGAGVPLRRPLGLANALVECRASGATSVFNRAVMQHLQRLDSSDAVMHDAWVYLVATAFGRAYFDDRAFILYRQHTGNHTGAHLSASVQWRRRLHRRQTVRQYWLQAASLLRQTEPDLPPASTAVIRRFVEHRGSVLSRLKFAAAPSVRYQRARSDWVYRCLVLLGQS